MKYVPFHVTPVKVLGKLLAVPLLHVSPSVLYMYIEARDDPATNLCWFHTRSLIYPPLIFTDGFVQVIPSVLRIIIPVFAPPPKPLPPPKKNEPFQHTAITLPVPLAVVPLVDSVQVMPSTLYITIFDANTNIPAPYASDLVE
jgi:hypothetical protein